MNDLSIKSVGSLPLEETGDVPSASRNPFTDFEKALSQSLQELNGQLTKADQSVQEMLLGKKDVHQAMIDMEEAGLSLRLMIQIRSKIIAAYEEIMRMQL